MEKKTYTLYKLHPLEIPQQTNNVTHGCAYLKPSCEYIGLGNDLLYFFKTTETFLQECRKTRHSIICHNNLLLQRVENTDDCELKLLMNPSTSPKNKCDIRVKPHWEEKWIFLKYQNQWLFSGIKETSGVVTCGQLPSKAENLPPMGVLELANGCTLQTKRVLLQGRAKIIGRSRFNYITSAHLDLKKINPEWQLSETAINLPGEGIELSNVDWEHDGKSLKEINQELTNIAEHRSITTWQTYSIFGSFSFTFILLLTSLIGGYYWILRERNQYKVKGPEITIVTPLPESQDETTQGVTQHDAPSYVIPKQTTETD